MGLIAVVYILLGRITICLVLQLCRVQSKKYRHDMLEAPCGLCFLLEQTRSVMAGCRKRRLRQVSLVLLGLVFGVPCVYLGCCRCDLSVPQPSDWLKRLVPEMTYYVTSGTLNSTHSLIQWCRSNRATKCHRNWRPDAEKSRDQLRHTGGGTMVCIESTTEQARSSSRSGYKASRPQKTRSTDGREKKGQNATERLAD